MKYEDVEIGRTVKVISGKHRGAVGTIIDRWPPREPTIILDNGDEYPISDVELEPQGEYTREDHLADEADAMHTSGEVGEYGLPTGSK